MGMGKPKKDFSNVDQLVLLLKENRIDWKHKTAIAILIHRFSDIEKARQAIYCLENMGIDELQTELLKSIRVLLNDE